MKKTAIICFFILSGLISGCELFEHLDKRILEKWNVVFQDGFSGTGAVVGNGWSQEFCYVSNDQLVLQGTNGDTGSGITRDVALNDYRITIRFFVETTNFTLACYLATTDIIVYAFAINGPSHNISFWSTKPASAHGYFLMETNTRYTGIFTKREGLFKLEIAETGQSIQTYDNSYGPATNIKLNARTVDTPPDQTNHCYVDFIKVETPE